MTGAMGGVVLAAAPAHASLNCYTNTYRTVGKGTCSGYGFWRTKGDCANEGDVYSSRINQQGGTVSQYVQCTFNINATYVIIG